MPGVTVEDEVGRLILRGYQLVSRGDNEALLAQPRSRSGKESTLLVLGILLGIAGVIIGLSTGEIWMTYVGIGVTCVTIVLYAVTRRPAGVRVFVNRDGQVQHQRVRGSHW